MYKSSMSCTAVGFYSVLSEHVCPWKVSQWPDWDASTETDSFTVKCSEQEWRMSRSWADYVKIMESFKLKMKEDSLAIFSCLRFSLFPFIWVFFSPALCDAYKHTLLHLIICTIIYLFCKSDSNVEQNLHIKSPVRVTLVIPRCGTAHKKGLNAWIKWRNAEAAITDQMHILTFEHVSVLKQGCTKIQRDTHVRCSQPLSSFIFLLYLNLEPLDYLQQRRNKWVKEFFQSCPWNLHNSTN